MTDAGKKLVEAVAILAYRIHHNGDGVLLNEDKRSQGAWKSLSVTFLAAIDAAGWQIVPKVPTEEMRLAMESAAVHWLAGGRQQWSVAMTKTYDAMLAAAPKVVP